MTETEAAKEETPAVETAEAQDPPPAPVEDTEMKTEATTAPEEEAKEEETTTTEPEPTNESTEKKTPPSEVKAPKPEENGEETPMEVEATEAVKSEDTPPEEEAPSTTEEATAEEPAATAEAAETPVKSEEPAVETPTPKRKRGRPRKKSTNQQVLIKEAEGHTTPQTKRARKSTSVNSYSPANFKTEPEPGSATKKSIPPGRGTKLKDIPSVKANVDKIKSTDPVLHKAFRLLYGGPGGIIGRGPLNKKELKKNLLEFSGYLPPLTNTEGLTEEEKEKLEDQEDQLEEKFATKAHEFKIPLLKSLCDLFDISRTYAPGTKTIPDKEGLVDLLLDFLGAPNVSLTKSAKKKKRGPSPKKSPKPVVLDENGNVKKRGPGRPRKNAVVVEAVVEPEEESEGEDEVIDGKTIPSEKKLRKWVKAYVNCFNLEKATTNHAIETASDKFGVDLACKKEKIKDLLAEEMS